MSYPPLTGYGNYDYSNQNQTAHPSYGSSRQTGSSSYGQQYQQDDTQPQYGSSGYDWQGQHQSNYPNSQQPYANESGRDANGQAGQYDYRREASNYATQAAAGSNVQGYYGTHTGQPMQGLNNLAYASQLDNPPQTSSRPQQQSGSTLKYSTTPSSAINRVQSPMQGLQQQQCSGSQQANYSGRDGTPSSTSSPQLAISAAQALAGAVSRKYQQSARAQKTTSPAMPTAPSVQRTSSPFSASSKTQSHARGSPGQSQTNQRQQLNQRVTSPAEAYQQAPSGTQNRSSQHNRGSSQTKRSGASQSSNISNLVSTTQEPQTSATMATDSMPAFIDPTQVFNPYHKEHERRRKEAAEAEARRKEQEAAAAKAQEEQKRKEAEVAKSAKKTPNKQKGVEPTPPATSPEVDEMAAEMRNMMEKMKEFRSKDPSLFQKLWDDMRKGGSSGAASSASYSAAPATTISTVPAPSTSPKVTQQSGSAGPSPQPEAASTKPRKRLPKSQQHPSAASNFAGHPAANGYKVIVEDNEEDLPDLGRFPAERRIRGSYQPKQATPATQMPTPAVGSFPTPGLDSGPLPNQPLPAKSASGGVEWPKDKRDVLAAAAMEALRANPENAKIGIAPVDIHTMLEQNPSYIQLCDLLEKKGARFHRGQFARQLLSSVPDLTTPQKSKESAHPKSTPTPVPPPVQQQQPSPIPRPPAPSPHPPMGPAGHPPPPQHPQGIPVGHPPPPMPPNGFVPGPPPHFQPQGPPGQFQSQGPVPFQHIPYPYIPPAIKPEQRPYPTQKQPPKPKRAPMLPTKPEPPPGSKEAMARKRDFSELIDLTTLSDNEDYVLSSKHPRMDSPSPEPDPFEKYQMQQNMQPNTVAPGHFASNSLALPVGSPLKFNPMQPARAPAAAPPPPQKPKSILARPVNKSEALRKSYYDPKTVARDILIAAGRHPTERPLNAHMAGLLGVHIDLDSDLSTFDWDAIDPGGPPAPKVEYVNIPAGPPRFHLGERVHKSGPKPRAEAEREPRAAESGKREMQEPPAATTPQFGKFKHLVNRTVGDQVKSRGELKPSKLRQAQTVDAESPARAVTPQKRKLSVDSSPRDRSLGSESRQVSQSMEVDPGALYPSGKRRGRPVGSKNKHHSLTAMRKMARPPPQVEIPRSSSPQGNPVYKCRWKGCRAELHNFDTLRKHVSRVHTPTGEELADHGYVCWWKRCRYHVQNGDEIINEHTFDTADDWMEHINEDHLHKVAMKLGDGPNAAQIGKHTSTSLDVSQFRYNPTSTEASARIFSYTDPQTLAQDKTRYLSDSHGRATTPSLSEKRNADLPPDTLILTKAKGENANSDMAAQKSFLKVHHRDQKIGAKMNAEEVLRAMEKRKRDIGPGIDRGGCTLVNEARRSTFVQSPGVRRVVDGDY